MFRRRDTSTGAHRRPRKFRPSERPAAGGWVGVCDNTAAVSPAALSQLIDGRDRVRLSLLASVHRMPVSK